LTSFKVALGSNASRTLVPSNSRTCIDDNMSNHIENENPLHRPASGTCGRVLQCGLALPLPSPNGADVHARPDLWIRSDAQNNSDTNHQFDIHARHAGDDPLQTDAWRWERRRSVKTTEKQRKRISILTVNAQSWSKPSFAHGLPVPDAKSFPQTLTERERRRQRKNC
jgi:hypothetical protein